MASVYTTVHTEILKRSNFWHSCSAFTQFSTNCRICHRSISCSLFCFVYGHPFSAKGALNASRATFAPFRPSTRLSFLCHYESRQKETAIRPFFSFSISSSVMFTAIMLSKVLKAYPTTEGGNNHCQTLREPSQNLS